MNFNGGIVAILAHGRGMEVAMVGFYERDWFVGAGFEGTAFHRHGSLLGEFAIQRSSVWFCWKRTGSWWGSQL